MAVTRDAALVAALRRDGVNVVAHVEDTDLARALAESTSFEAVFVDEAMAGELTRSWGALKGDGSTPAPSVYVLRSAADWSPSPLAPSPVRTSRSRRRGGAVSDVGGSPDTASWRPAPVAGGAALRPQPTLREWWLGSLQAESAGGLSRLAPEQALSPRPVEASRSPEVLMRQTITVVSPKGGVGKTLVSVNLAASLARHTGFRVLLLDLDLLSGDATVHLDLVGQPTLAELLPYLGRLETAHLGRAVVTHAASHLDVLLAPAKPEAAESLSREHLGALVRLLKQNYDFLIIDTPPNPSDPLVAECIAEATAVILVSSLDAAALRQCRLFLDALMAGARGDLRRRLVLVLNQVHDRGPLPAARALSFLLPSAEGVTALRIPEDRGAVEKAVFDGRPLSLSEPGHAVSRAIFELANVFCPVFSGLMDEGRARRSGVRRLMDVLAKW